MLFGKDAEPFLNRRRLLAAGFWAAGGALVARPNAALADNPASYDTAGTFTAPQTIDTPVGPALTLQVPRSARNVDVLQTVDGTTGALLHRLTNIAPSGNRAGVLTFEGSAGHWAQGIDVAAAIGYRDYFIGKQDWPVVGSVKDTVYFNHGGASTPKVDFFGAAGTAAVTVNSPTNSASDPVTMLVRPAGQQAAPGFVVQNGFGSDARFAVAADGTTQVADSSGRPRVMLDASGSAALVGAGDRLAQAGGIRVLGDTQPSFSIAFGGRLQWGSGNAATDTALSRYGPGTLATTAAAIQFVATGSGSPSISARSGGDTEDRWRVRNDGRMYWGDGSALDTSAWLGRLGGGGGLTTPGKLVAASGLGAGNSVKKKNVNSAGPIVRMLPVFDAAGNVLGGVPIYASGSFS